MGQEPQPQERPLWDTAAYQEMTRRAVKGPEHQAWAEYFLLLNACADIVRSAPGTLDACAEFSPSEQLGEDLTRIAGMIALILPGGAEEFQSYMTEASRHPLTRPGAARTARMLAPIDHR